MIAIQCKCQSSRENVLRETSGVQATNKGSLPNSQMTEGVEKREHHSCFSSFSSQILTQWYAIKEVYEVRPLQELLISGTLGKTRGMAVPSPAIEGLA